MFFKTLLIALFSAVTFVVLVAWSTKVMGMDFETSVTLFLAPTVGFSTFAVLWHNGKPSLCSDGNSVIPLITIVIIGLGIFLLTH